MMHVKFLWTYVQYCLQRACAVDREAGQSVEHVLWYVLGAAAVLGIAGFVYAEILAQAKKGFHGP